MKVDSIMARKNNTAGYAILSLLQLSQGIQHPDLPVGLGLPTDKNLTNT